MAKEKMTVKRSSLDGQRHSLITALGLFLWHLPRVILCTILKFYRRFISPIYGQVCRFFPSCSAYALEAVTVHGAVKGSYFASRRILRCHPWNAGGIDPVPSPAHVNWENPAKVPIIVQLNNPEYFLAQQAQNQSRPAA